MSINPIENSQVLPLTHSYPSTSSKKALPVRTFTEAVNNATQKLNLLAGRDPITAATAAAELLKLEMMKNALSLGGETSSSSYNQMNIPLKLTLANLITDRQEIDRDDNIYVPQIETASRKNNGHQSEGNVQEIVEKASQKFGVDEALIKAVIKAESNFNPSAVSHAGAQGLMQLMPATAKGLGVNDSFNPEQNIMAGTRFLKDMMNRYNGNLDSALAAYNWGPGNVDRKGTTSLPQETREYLAKVKSFYSQYNA